MKKFVSVLLCLALVITTCTVFVFAEDNKEEEYPLVFVTGIGQSYSYFYKDTDNIALDQADNSTDRADARWNLFCNDFSFLFKEFSTYAHALGLVFGVLCTIVTGKNCVSEVVADKLVSSIFRYNIIDKDGKLPENVVTPRYCCSVADMTEEQKEGFYHTIPCQEVLGDVGEDMLYVFNYSAFSFTYDNAKDLDAFIEKTVLEQTDAEKVVLIPMSMGASVVSAYLQDYGTKDQVARVVSIVGAWDGSDVFADLIELKYCDNSPDLFYNGVIADLVGDPWGNLVNVVLRVFKKQAARDLIDEVLGSIIDNLVLKTPSLLALIPKDRYPDIREKYLANNKDLDYILAQTDKYYECQKGLQERLNMLHDEHGVDFFYIAGYGLGFGGYSSDYEFFKFFKNAPLTNSDEIIQISSTATGATFVAAGTEFSADYLAKVADTSRVSPDNSVDTSTCFFPDRVWLFEGQKHELENNNTALKLAFDLATGVIDDINDNPEKYPQFNGSRDLKKLNRSYIPDLETWLKTNTPTAEQQALIDENTAKVNEMKASTINNREADDKVIENYRQMLITLGVYAPDSEPGFGDKALSTVLGGLNSIVNGIVGSKGIPDLIK